MKDFERIKKMFHVGDIICVKEDLSETDRTFTTTPEMTRLIGSKIEVKDIKWNSSHNEPCIYAAGWSWHPNDLYVVEYVSEDPLIVDGPDGIFTFNPKDL